MDITEKYSLLHSLARWSVGDAAELLRVPQRQIHRYFERGVFKPSDASPGTGNHRRLTMGEMLLLKVAVHLSALGVRPVSLRKILLGVRDALENSEAGMPRMLLVLPGSLQVSCLDDGTNKDLGEELAKFPAPIILPMTLMAKQLLDHLEADPAVVRRSTNEQTEIAKRLVGLLAELASDRRWHVDP